MDTELQMTGALKETFSTIGWIETTEDAPPCMFCEQQPQYFKPAVHGWIWWCKPCETTWTTKAK